MRNKRVFVSGAAGVVGLELVPRLVARGAVVLAADLKPRPPSFPPVVTYRQGDLNHATQSELDDFAPEVFIHLAAAFERSTESYEFWEENFWHNVRLSHHLMTLLKDSSSLRRVVFASSYLIYDPALYLFDFPRAEPVALAETAAVSPRNLTGMAKLAHEIELRFIDSYRAEQFTAACARIFRGYGRNSRDVISRWIRALLQGEPITVFRPEGMFDYIYAADSAEGLIRLAEAPHVTGILNLGTGRARRVAEVVHILRRHFPRLQTIPVESDAAYEASQADTSALAEGLGWVPAYDLEQGIAEIVAHERSRAAEAPTVASRATLRILVTSASKKIPLINAVQAAARKIDPAAIVVAGDSARDALAAHVADEFWAMPPTTDERVDEILDGCVERDIKVVLPTRDGELLFWARNVERFKAAGVAINASSAEAIEMCVDKLRFSRFGAEHRLPFIASALSLEDLHAQSYVVKERFGSGARGIGLDLSRDEAQAHARRLVHPIFQPYVPGTEVSVDAWLDRHHAVKGLMLRRRDAVANGESQVTTTFDDADVEAQVKRALEALRLSGPVVVQAIMSADSTLHIIECNARFGGASTCSIAAGLDSFYWSLLEACGESTERYPFHRIRGQLRQVRVPYDIHTRVDDSDIRP